MRQLGIEFISGLGMPPLEFIALAGELGCNGVGMALAPFTANPHSYPGWSLREDAGLRRAVVQAQSDSGVAIQLGEGFLVRTGADVSDSAADLDLFAELGVPRVNILAIDSDVPRSIDQLAQFVEMADMRGLAVTLEYMAGTALGNLATVLDVVRQIGRPNFTLLVDAMHLARAGDTVKALAAADPALIGYLQLCDVKHKPLDSSYGEEAKHNRLALGEGDLPLAALVAACPPHIPVGIEIPMLARAEAGEGPETRLARSVATAKHLIGAH